MSHVRLVPEGVFKSGCQNEEPEKGQFIQSPIKAIYSHLFSKTSVHQMAGCCYAVAEELWQQGHAVGSWLFFWWGKNENPRAFNCFLLLLLLAIHNSSPYTPRVVAVPKRALLTLSILEKFCDIAWASGNLNSRKNLRHAVWDFFFFWCNSPAKQVSAVSGDKPISSSAYVQACSAEVADEVYAVSLERLPEIIVPCLSAEMDL